MALFNRNAPATHPAIGNHSWAFPIRILQFVFAALVLGLSAYTLSWFPDWKECRFMVATGAWGVLSIAWMLTSAMSYRPVSHHALFLLFEVSNWAMFLAAWIAISVNIGKKQACVAPNGGHSHIRPCDTIYAAVAFAIVEWLLWCATLFGVGTGLSAGRTSRIGTKTTNPVV